MQEQIMSIFTRTPLHVGAGSSVGAVDQPVVRERHTEYPVIPGSAVKGVLRDYVSRDAELKAAENMVFGYEPLSDKESGKAGIVGFCEAKLLAFPLRSARGSFAMATSPLALARYARDKKLDFAIPQVAEQKCQAGTEVILNGKVALEEYVFENAAGFPADWAEHLSGLLNDVVLNAAKDRFVLLSNDDFSHFVKNACLVQYHNKIDENGTVADQQLFNTETVPSETLFYAVVYQLKKADEANKLIAAFADEKLLQFGGNCTTGLGFCTVKMA